MKTPETLSHEKHPSCQWPSQPHSRTCEEAARVIAARDAEHSRRTELARDRLRMVIDWLEVYGDERGIVLADARAALEALGEK